MIAIDVITLDEEFILRSAVEYLCQNGLEDMMAYESEYDIKIKSTEPLCISLVRKEQEK